MAQHLLSQQREVFDRENVVGPKSTPQKATILIDSESKREVSTHNEIKRGSLDYCSILLTNRKPKPEFTLVNNHTQR